MKKLSIIAVLLVGSIVAVGLTSEPAGRSQPASSTSGRSYSHEVLQRDAAMTQRMSAPNADGPMQRGPVRDEQLDHSQDPAFVGALEQHQADIDRMLARPAP